jgi:hypothetical protein
MSALMRRKPCFFFKSWRPQNKCMYHGHKMLLHTVDTIVNHFVYKTRYRPLTATLYANKFQAIPDRVSGLHFTVLALVTKVSEPKSQTGYIFLSVLGEYYGQSLAENPSNQGRPQLLISSAFGGFCLHFTVTWWSWSGNHIKGITRESFERPVIRIAQ